jgi:hypothetical protein
MPARWNIIQCSGLYWIPRWPGPRRLTCRRCPPPPACWRRRGPWAPGTWADASLDKCFLFHLKYTIIQFAGVNLVSSLMYRPFYIFLVSATFHDASSELQLQLAPGS